MSLSGVSVFLLLVSIFLISSCSAVRSEPVWKRAVAGDGPGNPALLGTDSIDVGNLPKSRSGNRSEYEVFGIRYAVLDSARDFSERGVASWYGSKFHGRPTASGEIYDMHQMTAAHKHLPLPTFVRVTRIDNGESIVVKVNDRGPFVGDRVLDLSYAAAARLDMLDSGKAEVFIEALSDHEPEKQALTVPLSPVQSRAVGSQANGSQAVQSQAIQVGAFTDVDNAEALMQQVEVVTQLSSYVDFEQAQQLYRVRVGPLEDQFAVKDSLSRLESEGLSGFPVGHRVR